MFIREYELQTAAELLDLISPWHSNFQDFVFRGHSCSSFSLLPSSLREDKHEDMYNLSLKSIPQIDFRKSAGRLLEFEYQVIREFYKLADANGLNVPHSVQLRKDLILKYSYTQFITAIYPRVEWLPEELWELAALTQHYGLPTRLLDWTYDPFIAAYFASKHSVEEERDGKLMIWGLDKEVIGLLKMTDTHIPLSFVTPHYSENPNINAQKGLFTHFKTTVDFKSTKVPDRTPLDAQLKACIPEEKYIHTDIFIKITLPNTQARQLFTLLQYFNYGTARMFPGYDGVARQVYEKSKLMVKRD